MRNLATLRFVWQLTVPNNAITVMHFSNTDKYLEMTAKCLPPIGSLPRGAQVLPASSLSILAKVTFARSHSYRSSRFSFWYPTSLCANHHTIFSLSWCLKKCHPRTKASLWIQWKWKVGTNYSLKTPAHCYNITRMHRYRLIPIYPNYSNVLSIHRHFQINAFMRTTSQAQIYFKLPHFPSKLPTSHSSICFIGDNIRINIEQTVQKGHIIFIFKENEKRI